MIIRYKRVPGETSARPWVALMFERNPSIPIFALVDSGSDRSSFPLKLGVALGFKYDQDSAPSVLQGAGWQFEYWEATNNITVQSEVGKFTIYAPLLTRGGIDHPLLGRQDFFSQFTIKFDEKAEAMDLEPYDRPSRPN